MALALDGSAHANTGNALSVTPTLTTTQANDIICVFAGPNGAPISSVTSANLTFTQKASDGIFFSLWTAVASAPLSSEVITVTQTTSDFMTADAFAVSGADTATIWDGAAVTGSPDPLTISTTAANTMIIAGYRMGSQGGPSAGAGFTQISGADFQLAEYKIVSSPQTNLSVTITTGATDANGGIAIAILQASGDVLMAQIWL